MIPYTYSVPEKWGESLYKDEVECCRAARPFSLVHEEKSDECWLLIHGYRGYPGEMVRPAEDLCAAGYDVFVPRLPGCGTSEKDFERSRAKDWLGMAQNAIDDLKTKYKKVNVLGHSLGSTIAMILTSDDADIGKRVYVAPTLKNTDLTCSARIKLRLLSLFTPAINCGWRPDTRFHLHYDGAPCDDVYLGGQYWQYYFTKQLIDYSALMKKARKAIKRGAGSHLVICPVLDKKISAVSTEIFTSLVKDANAVYIENGTHLVLYDIDPAAEEKAVRAILDYAGQAENI